MIRVVGKRGKGPFKSQLEETVRDRDFVQIDCTSGNKDEEMKKGLSPFYLGPVECYDGLKSETFERAWQCAKVYPWMADAAGNPDGRYFEWRDLMWRTQGFGSKIDIRFPAGKGNARKCLYAWWKVDGEFKKLGYVDGRKHIYLPLYARAVVKTEAYRRLVELRDSGKNLMLIDFDGYNPHHPKYNFTYNDVLHCPILKMGHGFVLAMLLDGVIKVGENGEISYAEGLMTPPEREWPADLRKLSPEALLARNAARCKISAEEYSSIDEVTRKLLWNAGKKASIKLRGFTIAGWERLPLAEKLSALNALR